MTSCDIKVCNCSVGYTAECYEKGVCPFGYSQSKIAIKKRVQRAKKKENKEVWIKEKAKIRTRQTLYRERLKLRTPIIVKVENINSVPCDVKIVDIPIDKIIILN